MYILVFNHGSSSLKCSLYCLDNVSSTFIPPKWEAHLAKTDLNQLPKLLKSLPAPFEVIGHRIVHGGKEFRESVLITEEVKRRIALCTDLAPLHNAEAGTLIDTLESLCQGIPQVAVFDTAFHRTIPDAAAIYPGPYKWVEAGIRRYGFHGISYQYCSRRAEQFLGMRSKMVICHLGAGASLCAIQDGKSVDTTMGFTPLEGLMMDTRSGSIDPGILLYLLEKDPTIDLSQELYYNSGLFGLSGISGDMREVLQSPTSRAKLAIDVYLHRLSSCLGSMIASLGGIDTLVFTAGIGENAPSIRERLCKAFSFLNLQLDLQKNKTLGEDGLLSTKESAIQVLLIHTKEEFEIANECFRVVTVD